MGHRTLVAYRQTDGTFTLRYAHWGRDLATAIGPKTPLGGPASPPDTATVADHLDVDSHGSYAPLIWTRVDPRPLAEELTAHDVLAAVDANYESLVVVSPAYEITTYLVCSLELTTHGTDLVLANPDDDPEAVRAWFVETKSRLSAAVGSGLSREAARATLRRALLTRAALYSLDDASFLRDQ